MKTIGILGTGTVGEVLADGFLKHGYEVMRGSRDAGEARGVEAAGRRERPRSGTFADAAESASVVVLAVKGTAAEDALRARRPADTSRARP